MFILCIFENSDHKCIIRLQHFISSTIISLVPSAGARKVCGASVIEPVIIVIVVLNVTFENKFLKENVYYIRQNIFH